MFRIRYCWLATLASLLQCGPYTALAADHYIVDGQLKGNYLCKSKMTIGLLYNKNEGAWKGASVADPIEFHVAVKPKDVLSWQMMGMSFVAQDYKLEIKLPFDSAFEACFGASDPNVIKFYPTGEHDFTSFVSSAGDTKCDLFDNKFRFNFLSGEYLWMKDSGFTTETFSEVKFPRLDLGTCQRDD